MENILAAMRNNFCEKTNTNENIKDDVLAEMRHNFCEKSTTESATEYRKTSDIDNDDSDNKKLTENSENHELMVKVKDEPVSDDESDNSEKAILLPIYQNQDKECIEICHSNCLAEPTMEKAKNSENCLNSSNKSLVPTICIKREDNDTTQDIQQIKLESKNGDEENVHTLSDFVNTKKDHETEELQDIIKTEELVVAWTEDKHDSSCSDELPDFRGEHFSIPKFEDEAGSNAEYAPEFIPLQDEEEKDTIFEVRQNFLESEDENEDDDLKEDGDEDEKHDSVDDDDDDNIFATNIKRKRREKRNSSMEQTEMDIIADLESEPLEKWCCKIRGKACFLCLNEERFQTKESLMQHIRNSHMEVKLVGYKLKPELPEDGIEKPRKVFYLVDSVEDGFGLCIECYMVFYTTERATTHMISHVKNYHVNMPRFNTFRSCCKENTRACVQPTIVCGECKCQIRRSDGSLIRHGSRHWIEKGLFYPFRGLGTGAISRVSLPKHYMKSNLYLSASIDSNDSSDYKIVTTILANDKCVPNKDSEVANNVLNDNNKSVNAVVEIDEENIKRGAIQNGLSANVNNVLSEMQQKFCTAPDSAKTALSSDTDLPYDKPSTRHGDWNRKLNNPQWKSLKSVKIIDDIDIVEQSCKKNDKDTQESPSRKNVTSSSESSSPLLALSSNNTERDERDCSIDVLKLPYLKDGNIKYTNGKKRKMTGEKRQYLFISDIYGNSTEDVIVEVESSKSKLKNFEHSQIKRKKIHKKMSKETGSTSKCVKIGLAKQLKQKIGEEYDRPSELVEDETPTPKFRSKNYMLVEDGNKDVEVPEGWNRVVLMRTVGKYPGAFDVYYQSPSGNKLRSKVQVEKHCEKNGLEIDLSILKFNHKANDIDKSLVLPKVGNDSVEDHIRELEDYIKDLTEHDGSSELLEVEEFKDVPGWRRKAVKRKNGYAFDIYYSPCGKKLRSRMEIEKYCLKQGIEVDLNLFQFTYNRKIRLSHKSPRSQSSKIMRNNSKTTKMPRDGETPKGNQDQLKESQGTQDQLKESKENQDQLKESTNSDKEEGCSDDILIEPTNSANSKMKKVGKYDRVQKCNLTISNQVFPYNFPNPVDKTKGKMAVNSILTEMQHKFCTKTETSENRLCIEDELSLIKSVKFNLCKSKQNFFRSSKNSIKRYTTGKEEDKFDEKCSRIRKDLQSSKSSSKKLKRSSRPENVFEPFRVKDYIRSHVNHNDYPVLRTRQQFWEEPQVQHILDGVKKKELDMKCAAGLLGVPYGTLYAKYRENYGLIRFSGPNNCVSVSTSKDCLIWEEAPTQALIAQVLNKEITLSAAAESLGLTTRTIINYLRNNGEALKKNMLIPNHNNDESDTVGKINSERKINSEGKINSNAGLETEIENVPENREVKKTIWKEEEKKKKLKEENYSKAKNDGERNSMGRLKYKKKGPIWDKFILLPKDPKFVYNRVSCKICNKMLSGSVPIMKVHLKTCRLSRYKKNDGYDTLISKDMESSQTEQSCEDETIGSPVVKLAQQYSDKILNEIATVEAGRNRFRLMSDEEICANEMRFKKELVEKTSSVDIKQLVLTSADMKQALVISRKVSENVKRNSGLSEVIEYDNPVSATTSETPKKSKKSKTKRERIGKDVALQKNIKVKPIAPKTKTAKQGKSGKNEMLSSVADDLTCNVCGQEYTHWTQLKQHLLDHIMHAHNEQLSKQQNEKDCK